MSDSRCNLQADLSAWRIETTDLTELNIARIREGSQAAVTFDAMPSLKLVGRISHIRALGENKQGDITYIAPSLSTRPTHGYAGI